MSIHKITTFGDATLDLQVKKITEGVNQNQVTLTNALDTHTGDTANPHSTSDSNLIITDTTTNNVSDTKHGFCPKLPNDTTKFLRGDGTYEVPSYIGYTLSVMAASFNPADGATYYFGCLPALAPQTTAVLAPLYIPKAGTIKAAYITWRAATVGTNESISMYIRKNNSTDTLIQTIGSALAVKVFANTSLSITVAQGDYIEIKLVCPTWATNPATVALGGVIYVE